MPTVIELYILSYALLFFLMAKSVKAILKTPAKTWAILVCALVFSIIKFLMDYFSTVLVAQIFVVFFYCLTANLGLNKFSHVSGLIIGNTIFAIFYICLLGINAGLSLIAGYDIYYISNLYLVLVCGISLIVYSLIEVFLEYSKLKNNIKLTKLCTLKIGGRSVQFSGFVDTGNSLKDPVSGKSVVIVSISLIKKYLTTQMYADILFATNASGHFDSIHKIKYSTISGTNFITVFKPNYFTAENKQIECYIGVSANEIGCGALLNVACL